MHAKAIQDRDSNMEIACEGVSTMACKRYYEEEAQAVAGKFGIPILELSYADIHPKAILDEELYIDIASKCATTKSGARFCEKVARGIAKKYGISVPELSDADIHAKGN